MANWDEFSQGEAKPGDGPRDGEVTDWLEK